ncbi:hypothetical protein LTR04_002067 [Oleoguttula sp. CCFEE 6159]|nr:hypothetical protein LTR04_002067 [Oleoguttula sp. CCFEE 6159]
MQPLNSATNGYSPPTTHDTHRILEDCMAVDRAIDELERRLNELTRIQRGFVSGNGTTTAQVDSMGAEIMGSYRAMTTRVKKIKSTPGAANPQNAPQVGRLDRKLQKAINDYQNVESQFRREVEEQQARQYRIVRPNASEEEVQEAISSGGDQQIFQQAASQSQSALRSVQQRHDAIQQIERTMEELSHLFQDLAATVLAQDAMIEDIETKAVETDSNVKGGVVHLGTATTSARAARRKKWWCLGIVLLIIIIIVVAIVAWYFAAGPGAHKTGPVSASELLLV